MPTMNFGRLVDQQRIRRGEKPALISEDGEVWTYERLAVACVASAVYLAQQGI